MRTHGLVTKAPQMPSPQEEAELGFDAKLSGHWGALFLQFKISRFLTRPSAAQWPYWRAPYYRFDVKTDEVGENDWVQHNVLVQLEMSPDLDVYYMAPSFHAQVDLDEHWDAGTILDNSVVAPPSLLGPVAPYAHHVFTHQQGRVVAFSEPTPESSLPPVAMMGRLREKARQREPETFASFLQGLKQSMLQLSDLPSYPPDKASRDAAGPLRWIQARTLSLELTPFFFLALEDDAAPTIVDGSGDEGRTPGRRMATRSM